MTSNRSTNKTKERIKTDIQKHKSGMFYCQLTDTECPYGSALGWGKDEIEAQMNAWVMRNQILEKQLSTSPTMAIPVMSYKDHKQYDPFK